MEKLLLLTWSSPRSGVVLSARLASCSFPCSCLCAAFIRSSCITLKSCPLRRMALTWAPESHQQQATRESSMGTTAQTTYVEQKLTLLTGTSARHDYDLAACHALPTLLSSPVSWYYYDLPACLLSLSYLCRGPRLLDASAG